MIAKPVVLEEFKDRIWGLVFGNEPRGEKERRRRMEAEIPRE